MKKVSLIILTLVLASCSQKLKKDQPPADQPAPQSTPPVVDEAHEQKVDQLMSKVGNVHTPSSAELVVNAWCVVPDDDLNPTDPQRNHIKFSQDGRVRVNSPLGTGRDVEPSSGTWTLQSGQLQLSIDLGPASLTDLYDVSLARSPDAILLKLKPQSKPSLLYRDCDL